MASITKKQGIMRNLSNSTVDSLAVSNKPAVIDVPFSQMDIAPTILDMIDANVNDHHFMGNSIFSEKQSPVYLIQPMENIWRWCIGHINFYGMAELVIFVFLI